MAIPVQPQKPFPHGKFGVAALLLGLGMAAMAAVARPFLMHNQIDYKKIQEKGRADIDPSKTQPGDNRVWSSPFEPKKDDLRIRKGP